jgi:DNA modification methylase
MFIEDRLVCDFMELIDGELPVNKIVNGHVIEVLRKFPNNSVDCVVTSPPYWAKRQYSDANTIWGGNPKCEHEWVESPPSPTKLGVQGNTDEKYKAVNTGKPELGKLCKKCGGWYGQLGLEPTPQLFVDHLIEIFRELKRVLKPYGNVFVVIDDTYSGSGKRHNYIDPKYPSARNGQLNPKMFEQVAPRKSLCLVPEMFAIRMVYDLGFILRNKICWVKKVHIYKEKTTIGNAMPESVKDRLVHTWEYVYHFAKKQKYYYDLNAVRVPHKETSIKRDSLGYKTSPMKGRY